jgi:hypothetical protein
MGVAEIDFTSQSNTFDKQLLMSESNYLILVDLQSGNKADTI